MSETQQTQTPHDELQESKQLLEIGESSDGKHFLEIPKHHITTADFSIGENVQIYPINYNGNIALSISNDPDNGVKTKVRKHFVKDSVARITVPKQLATGAQLGGENIRYNSIEGGIIGMIDYEPLISGTIDVYNTHEIESMTEWSNGTYPYHIREETLNQLDINEKLWFWYDTLGNDFLFALETHEENAPETAIELSIQQRHNDSARAFVFLPRKVCNALGIKDEPMKWGHDKNRILGLIKGKE
jgi:hypothetical protein